MKTITTFFLLALLSLQAFACTFVPQDFCYTASFYKDATILRGVLTDSQQYSIDLDILNVYRGVETRQTVTIWDGVDIDCNGTLPMNVRNLGNVGDTIVLIVPIIDTLINNWEVIGDYRFTYLWFYSPMLHQQKDTLLGKYGNTTYKVLLSEFESNLNQCANQTVDIDPKEEIRLFEVFPNPAKDRFTIRSERNTPFAFTLYDHHGKAIRSSKPSGNQVEVNLQGLSVGIYALHIRHEGGILTEKIMVKGF